MAKISVDEFKERLGILCSKKGGRGLPRRPRDQQILFKSIALMLTAGVAYTEAEINQAMQTWLDTVGEAIELDHVTLRRHLVDEGFLRRDPAGVSYTLGREATAGLFDRAVEQLDPVTVVAEARQEQEQRKQAYQARQTDSTA